MGMLSIKIRIGEREYPMKVDDKEEEVIRSAAKVLNEKIKSFKELYDIEDKIDLLAMVAFDGIVSQIKYQNERSNQEVLIQDKLQMLTSLVSKAI